MISSSPFSSQELSEIIELVKQKIFVANAMGDLDSLLQKIGIAYKTKSIEYEYSYDGNPYGKVLILGDSSVKQNNITGMLKESTFGFTNAEIQKRFEFVFEYETLNSFSFNKLTKWNYAVILAGPMPHSIKGRDYNSSLLCKLEKNEDNIYPPVIRLTANSQLKITKQNVHDALLDLIKQGVIATQS